MSKEIEQRVVEMQFNNKNFEQNIHQSIRSIREFKGNLNFTSADKGLQNLNKTVKGMSFDKMSKAIHTVKMNLSSLNVVGFTTLQRLTNKAITTGKRITKALTINMPMDGFREYETQINATQTIMANTGKSVKAVNKALNKLNDYADLTIYNFSEMTKNAGMFTASGLGLKQTMTALKGVGNWAAFAGANSTQMANATYQLGQALNAGAIRLQDWMSIEHSAGMAGKKYKKAFIKTAKELGTINDKAKINAKNFRYTLEQGWLTQKVFMKTMAKFAKNKAMTNAATKIKTFTQLVDTLKESLGTGWATTWRTIIGNFKEAKKLFTSTFYTLNEYIGKSSDARNKLVKDWKKLGGRDSGIRTLSNLFKALLNVIQPIKAAFREVFPKKTAEDWYDMSMSLEKFSEKLILSKDKMKDLQHTFKAVFEYVKLAIDILKWFPETGHKYIHNFLKDINFDFYDFASGLADHLLDLKDWITQNELITKSISKVEDIFGSLFDKLAAVFNYFKKSKDSVSFDTESKEILQIRKAAMISFPSISKDLEALIEKLKKFKESIKGIKDFSFESIQTIVSKFFETVVGYKNNIDKSIEDTKNKANNTKNSVFKFIDSFYNKLKTTGKTIVNSIISIKNGIGNNLGGIMSIFASIGLIKTFKFVGRQIAAVIDLNTTLVKSLSELNKGFVNTITSLAKAFADFNTKVLGKIGDLVQSYQKFKKAQIRKINSEALMNVAKSIVMIAGALTVLSLIPEEPLQKAMMALGLITLLLYGLTRISSDVDVLKRTGATFLALSFSMKLIASALKTMQKLDQSLLVNNILLLGAIMAIMGTVIGVMGKYIPTLNSGIGLIIAFAFSIYILARALKVMGKIKEPIGRFVGAIIFLMIGLSACATLTRHLDKGFGLSMIGMAVMLVTFIVVLKVLSIMNLDGITKNIFAIIGIFAMLSILLVATRFAGQYAARAAGSLILVSGALLIIVGVLSLLNLLSPAALKKSIAALAMLELLFAGLIAVSYFAGPHAVQAGIMLLLISGALGILTIVIGALSLIKGPKLMKAIGAVAMLELLFATLIAVTILARSCKGTLVTLAIMTAYLGVIASLLSLLDERKLEASSKSLGLLMGAMSIMMGVTRFTTMNKAAFGGMVTLMLVTTGLAGVLAILTKFVNKNSITAALSLSTLMLALSASLFIMGSVVYVSKTAIIGMYALTGVITLLAVVMSVLSKMNIEISMNNVKALTLMLTTLTGSLTVLAIIGLLGPAAFIGIQALMTLIIKLGALMIAIGATISAFPKIEEFINKGLPMLEKLGVGLGSFFGGTVSGFITAASKGFVKSLPTIGVALSSFMTSAMPFFLGLKLISKSTMEGVKYMAEAMLLLTANNILQRIGSIFGGGRNNLVTFGKQLSKFAPYYWIFAKIVANTKPKVVAQSAKAAKSLAEFAGAIPNEGGLIAKVTGENDIVTFGKKLAKFAPYFLVYSFFAKGIKSKVVTQSAKAATSLAEFASKIPNEGGLIAKVTGENDIVTFGKKLSKFAPFFWLYSEIVKGVNSKVVKQSAQAATALTEFASKIPNEGGLLAKITGDNDIGMFGFHLSIFGTHFAKYAKSIKDVDPTVVTASATAAKTLADFAAAIPTKHIFDGKVSMKKFGKHLSKFGEELGEFYDNIKGINSTKLKNVTTEMTQIVSIAKNIGSVNIKKIKTFSNTLVNSISDMFNDISSTLKSGRGKLARGFSNFLERSILNRTIDIHRFTVLGAKYAAAIGRGIKTNGVVISTSLKGIIFKSLLSTILLRRKFVKHGSIYANNIAIGIHSKKDHVADTTKSLVENIIAKMKDKTSSFYSIGAAYMKALTQGMRSINNDPKPTINTHKGDEPKPKPKPKKLNGGFSISTHERSMVASFKELSYKIVRAFTKGLVKNSDIIKKNMSTVFVGNVKTIMNNIRTLFNGKSITMNQNRIVESIAKVGRALYLESSGYKESSKNIKQYRNDLKKLIVLQKKTKKEKKKNWQENLKNIKKDIKDVRMSIKREETKIVKDSINSFKEYQKQLRETVKDSIDILETSLDTQIDLFAKFEVNNDVTSKSILSNMQSQVDGFISFNDGLVQLAAKGLDKGLIEKIKEMGPEGLSYVKAFLSMTNEEILKANELFKKSSIFTAETFINNFTEHLATVKEWTKGITELTSRGISQELLKLIIDKGPDSFEYVKALLSMSAEQLAKINKLYVDSIKLPKVVSDKLMAAYVASGVDTAKGYTKGIKEGTPKAKKAVKHMGVSVMKTFAKTLGINSPSKKFEWYGKMSINGYIKSIKRGINSVKTIINELGASALAGMGNSIISLASVIDSEMETDPVITPVVDLSNVTTASKKIDNMFTTNKAANINSRMYQPELNQNGSTNTATGTNVNFVQNNYSPKPLSRMDIYRQTHNQISAFERRIK